MEEAMKAEIELEHQAREAPLKIAHTDKNVIEILTGKLHTIFSNVAPQREVVVVCIGTDRSTGDSLGPLVGSYLQKNSQLACPTYGTVDHPVHAINLEETLNEIYRDFHQPFIVGVDACLGQLSSVGCIQVGYGPVRPGAGVNKQLPPVGDIHVTGIVNVGGFMEYFVLQNTRLSLVMKMAEIISRSLYLSLLFSNRNRSLISMID
jgi:putative sporulation protein YyaC